MTERFAGSLADALRHRAERQAGQMAVHFLADGGKDRQSISYGELDRRARAVAASLRAHCVPGDRALLLLPSGLDYVAAFFGCLYAGVIAVPAYPPESLRPQHLGRLTGILTDAAPRVALAESGARDRLHQAFGERLPHVLAVDRVDSGAADDWRPRAAGSDIAFLQYTSGSTSQPKGVEVSHGNLLANERAIRDGIGLNADDVAVSWLPLYHDMGLIGGLLQPIFSGVPLVLMSPRRFLERPLRWLEAIAHHGGTISGGPDFAYRLCVERIREEALEGLDLSSWRVAFSGSEPIRHNDWSVFADTFARAGFRREAQLACYGLAEATLFVTATGPGQGAPALAVDGEALAGGRAQAGEGSILADCGLPQPEHRVRITDTRSLAESPPDRVGEVWFSGPSVARGYWRNPQASAETFVEHEGATWLRTGDLGFVHEGRLFVTGRLKDMIILRGQNLYPQDIERAVEDEIEVIRKGRVAAFAVGGDGGEGIGIAAEIGRGVRKLLAPEALAAAIRTAVADHCQEPATLVALLNPGALPKTSSGKLQRSACRAGLEDGSLDSYFVQCDGEVTAATSPVRHDPPQTPLQCGIAAIWCEVLGGEMPTLDDHFFALGGNSLAAVQVLARLREQLGLLVEPSVLFDAPRLGDFAAMVEAVGRAEDTSTVAPIRVLPRERGLALSPAQRRMWFHWRLDPHSNAYTICGRMQLRGPLALEALQGAFDDLIARHESLRTTFRDGLDGPEQVIHPSCPVRLHLIDTAPERVAELAQADAQAPFDLVAGPLLRVTLLTSGPDDRHLLVSLHHSIADGWSMNLMLEELAQLYTARCEGRVATLAALPVQYADFAGWQNAWLASGEGARQLAYWTQRLGSEHPVLQLPVDRSTPAAADGAGADVHCDLDDALAERLRALAQTRGVTLPSLLLASFKVLLYRYSGQTDLRVGCTVANRRLMQTERLIGFFVNMLVVRSDLSGRPRFSDLLDQVHHLSVEAQAHQDLPFEQLVEALQPDRDASRHPLFQVAYDHQWRRLDDRGRFGDAAVEAVEQVAHATQFDLILHTIETDDRLGAFLTYRCQRFERATVERLAGHWLNILRAVAAQPERAVDALPLLSVDERVGLIEGCNATDWNFGPETDVLTLIARQVALTPDAPALVVAETVSTVVAPVPAPIPDDPAVAADASTAAAAVSADAVETLSYRELDARSNLLAHRLRDLGVGPEVRVGIAAERSAELVIGLLGILKAGGAYVPLDTEYPPERLAYMLEDSGVGLVLTQTRLLDRLPPTAARVLCLDGIGAQPPGPGHHRADAGWVERSDTHQPLPGSGAEAEPSGYPDSPGAILSSGSFDATDSINPSGPSTAVPMPRARADTEPRPDGYRCAQPILQWGGAVADSEAAARAQHPPVVDLHGGNLAYLIYTSGSTGRPKGVGNTHEGLLNRLRWMQQAYALGPADRVLQKTPYSFDVSVWEFFWPLMAGATLVMAPPGAHRDPVRLRRCIVERRVSTVHFVPSMLQAFVASGELPACTSLRQVFCSGEALSQALAGQFQGQHSAELHNLYGPTEAAIDVTAWACGGAGRMGAEAFGAVSGREGSAPSPSHRPEGRAPTRASAGYCTTTGSNVATGSDTVAALESGTRRSAPLCAIGPSVVPNPNRLAPTSTNRPEGRAPTRASGESIDATGSINAAGPDTVAAPEMAAFDATGAIGAGVPIGHPIANTRIHLLDGNLEPVPIGVAGELYIGGINLARGYHGRAELTAERFIPDPFAEGGRLYRTGDLAKRRADGAIEYLGRIDHQVKIRGLRIELGEIEAALREQEIVRDAAVLDAGHDEAKRLMAYVVPDDTRLRALHDDDIAVQSALLEQWATVFDDTYRSDEVLQAPSFVGWNSSFDDTPIPHEQMQEWLETTIARILALEPEHLLEIGCGVGLLTQHLAPRCATYHGTDIAAQAIDRLGAWVRAREGLGHVRLSRRDAVDFSGVEPGSVDTVVINSVAQYFPDAEYLIQVLERAADVLRPGGRVFLGDLRHLGLQRVFHSAVQLARAPDGLTVAGLRHRIDNAVAQDSELLLDPAFFDLVLERIPAFTGARVELRRGRFDNELTRYRYDVVLTTGEPPYPITDGLSWSDERLNPAELEILLKAGSLSDVSLSYCGKPDTGHISRSLLSDSDGYLPQAIEKSASLPTPLATDAQVRQAPWTPTSLTVTGIPNRRLSRDLAQSRWLESAAGNQRIDAVRAHLASVTDSGEDPETFWTLAAARGYQAQVSWSADGTAFDVHFALAHTDTAPAGPRAAQPLPSMLASDPLLARRRQQLAPLLRERLRRRLPEYMVPAQITILGRLPVTVNGKLDRNTLLQLDATPVNVAHQPPCTPTEHALAAIWRQMLSVDRVGLGDNFFDLGGHSLLAIQVVSRIEGDLGVRLALRELFEMPDLASLAAHIDTQRTEGASKDRVADELEQALGELSMLSDEALRELAESAP